MPRFFRSASRPWWQRRRVWLMGMSLALWGLRAARPLVREFKPANPSVAARRGRALVRAGRKVLAVTAHPDDLEILCGGTLRLLHLAGGRVAVAVASDGGDQNTRANLAHTRQQEQQDAAQVLGYDAVFFLGLKARELAHTPTLRAALERVWEQEQPDLVLAFDPAHPAWMMVHPDHMTVGRVVVDIARARGSEAAEVVFYGTSDPDVLVDIKDVVEDKARALLQHKSQLRGPERLYPLLVRFYGRVAGFSAGLNYAEKFRLLQPRPLPEVAYQAQWTPEPAASKR